MTDSIKSYMANAVLTRRTSVLLRPEVHKLVKRLAKAQRVTVGEIIRVAVNAYIESWKESK